MKTTLRRILTTLTAAVLMAGTCCFSAAASADGVTIEIDQKTLTLEELEACDYTVPIYARLTENAGINAFEFGITVDARCTYEIVTASRKALDLGGEALDFSPSGNKADIAWFAWAYGEVETITGTMALVMVTLPENAQPGDSFAVDYVEFYSQSHVWYESLSETDFVKNGTVDYTSGGIRIAPAEGETLPSETEPTETPTIGDIDMDGSISILDAIRLSKALMGGTSLTVEQVVRADCDADSVITSADALALMKFLVRLVDALPIR